MEKKTFLAGWSIKQKIIAVIVMVAAILVSSSLVVTLTTIKRELMDTNKAGVQNIVNAVYNLVDGYSNKVTRGELSLEDAQKMALADVANMKYQGSNYIWVTTYNDDMLSHPTLAGQSISSVADKNGVRFFHDGVVLAKDKGEGFVDYHWTKQGESELKVFPKVSYFKSFPKWEWVIATGVYVDEVDNEVLNAFLQILFINIIMLVLVILAVIFTVVKDIVNSMQKIAGELTDSSLQVASASSQLEQTSERLAEGSAEQAASIQETSSTLEETSSMVQQNNENTKQAAVLAKQSKEAANKSNSEMGKMINAMSEIQTSSAEISKIIKVIDEIAFQTNILSLNAAVEAARAGEAGKGFAVVAEEVRNLAQRSAQAAKDTTVIIERNIDLSQTGAELSKIVQKSIMEIDEQSKKVSDLLDEISVATNEQTQGISQINKAVSQMEEVISANAQTAEESSSASKTLYDQTINLNNIIDSLKMFVEGAKDKYSKISAVPKKQKQSKLMLPPKKLMETPVKKEVYVKPKAVAKPATKQKLSPESIIPLGDDMNDF